MRICSVTSCDRKHRRNGLCNMHDIRMKRTGTTDSPVRSQEDRFWAKVAKRKPSQCWLWTGATNERGYGVMRPAGQRSGPPLKVHRYSAELAGMDIVGKFVLHSCDNPPCVNPSHLRPGTNSENVRDMVSRHRHGFGHRNGNAKLTEDDVVEIRRRVAAGELHRVVAADYGVARTRVTTIVGRKDWRHVA